MATIQAKTNIKHSVKNQANTIWNNRNFIILLVTGVIVSLGNKVYELALPLILYNETHSASVMATMRGIEFLPNLLLAMFIGVIVDKVNKKRWSLWMLLFQAVILSSLFVLIQNNLTNLWIFYIAGFLLMTFNYAYYNARFGIVKFSIPNELLTPANASFSFISTLIGIMGPAITGVILMLSDLSTGLLITSVAFVIAFISFSFLTNTEVPVHKSGESDFWDSFKEGWLGLFSNKSLWMITILVIFTNSTAGVVDSLMVYFAKEDLALNNSQIGIIFSFAGIGGLVGSLIITQIRKYIRTGILLGFTTLLLGLSYLVMAVADNQWMLSFGLFLEGMFGTISSVCIWTFRQESTPQRLISRISGITGSLFKLGMPFAIFGAGFIAEAFTPGTVFIAAAISNLIIFIVYSFLPIWKMN